MLNTDLNRSPKEILEDLRGAAIQNAEPALKMGIIAVPFATLLVKLSQNAETTAGTIQRFTKWLVGLTIALCFLTFALLAIEGYQIYEKYYFHDQNTQTRKDGNE